MTYSQALTGSPVGVFLPNSTVAPDSGLSDGVTAQASLPGAFSGAVQRAMMNNSYLLCKNPDGSQSYYTYDAERSTPGNIQLRRLS